jgi:cytochrome b561
VLLQQHFLHWLEALSLIWSMSTGVIMVRTLESMLIAGNSITLLGGLTSQFSKV